MSERRVGILIGIVATIGAEIAVGVLAALVFVSLYYPHLRAKAEAVQDLEIPRSEVLDLYGDRVSVSYMSLQTYLAKKADHVYRGQQRTPGP